MRIAPLTLTLIAFALASASPASGQQLYRWVDADGVTHYSDSPPQGVQFETRAVRSTGSLGTSAPEPEPELQAIVAAAAAAAPRPPDPQRASRCQQARQNLGLLASGEDLMMDLDGDGVAEPLDATASADQLAQTRHQISAFCD